MHVAEGPASLSLPQRFFFETKTNGPAGSMEYAMGRRLFLGDGVAADERAAAEWY